MTLIVRNHRRNTLGAAAGRDGNTVHVLGEQSRASEHESCSYSGGGWGAGTYNN